MVHHLKIWPSYFEDILKGDKTFDVRKRYNDSRPILNGDFVRFEEYDPSKERYTGRFKFMHVTYVLSGPLDICGLPEGVVVLAIKDPKNES